MFNTFLDTLTVPPAGYSCSASGENVYGRKGAGGMDIPGEPVVEDAGRIGQVTELADPHPARELGQKWKVRPWIYLDPNVETPLLDTDGPGVVRHIWLTLEKKYFRSIIIRMYWDNEETPSVAVPLGDFFCNAPVYGGDMQSLAFCVNPDNAMNCYLPMPFRKHARITVEWLGAVRLANFYYTVNFTREPVAEDALYLHASFRRENPVKYGTDFTIVDGIKAKAVLPEFI